MVFGVWRVGIEKKSSMKRTEKRHFWLEGKG